MIEYELELSEAFADQVELLKAYDRISDKHLTDAMQGSLRGIQGLTRLNMPVFRGQARNSIDTSIKTIGSAVEGRVFSSIRNPYPYPLVIEFGRRPGSRMPPVAAIRRWVHLVIKPPAKQLNGLAFIIARAIGRRGIKGRYPLKKAVEASRPRIGMLFREALDRISREMAVD